MLWLPANEIKICYSSKYDDDIVDYIWLFALSLILSYDWIKGIHKILSGAVHEIFLSIFHSKSFIATIWDNDNHISELINQYYLDLINILNQ